MSNVQLYQQWALVVLTYSGVGLISAVGLSALIDAARQWVADMEDRKESALYREQQKQMFEKMQEKKK